MKWFKTPITVCNHKSCPKDCPKVYWDRQKNAFDAMSHFPQRDKFFPVTWGRDILSRSSFFTADIGNAPGQGFFLLFFVFWVELTGLATKQSGSPARIRHGNLTLLSSLPFFFCPCTDIFTCSLFNFNPHMWASFDTVCVFSNLFLILNWRNHSELIASCTKRKQVPCTHFNTICSGGYAK